MQPNRKPWVCVENGCSQCNGDGCRIRQVPSDCPFAIMHALDLFDIGLHDFPRRSGKTTKLLKIATDLVEAGFKVVLVSRDYSMMEYAKSMQSRISGKQSKIVFATKHNWKVDRQGSRYLILTDELSPADIDGLRISDGNEFCLGVWTDPANDKF